MKNSRVGRKPQSNKETNKQKEKGVARYFNNVNALYPGMVCVCKGSTQHQWNLFF